MFKLHFLAVPTVLAVCLVLKIPVLCVPCPTAFGSFQVILQKRQKAGKIHRDAALTLLRKRTFSNMECLDGCLRNAMCDFFELKYSVKLNSTRGHWICVIKRRENSMYTPLVQRASGWIHFNVSSQDLQEVSCY